MSTQRIIANRFVIDDLTRDLAGRGAMGDVYRGTDMRSGETVAIKALKPEIASFSPEMIERFERESEALRQLNHPNIVKMLAAVQDNGQHFLVMEFVEGGSLRDLLGRHGPLPIGQVIEIALDLADALTRVHRLHIIHRDLKPGNVMLTKDGSARLTDFGVAHFDNQTDLTSTGAVIGTSSYICPESCSGIPANQSTDIWSFGIILYEMLTGERPFRGDNPAAVLAAIMTQPVPDLIRIRPDTPEELVDLVYRILDKNPATRIASVRMIGASLEALAQAGYATPSPAEDPLVAPAANYSRPAFDTPTPSTSSRRHNLPTQTTPFIGRERELSEIMTMLADDACHLVTLLGPDGIGKSRLAIEIASRLLDRYADGAYFVPLVALSSADAVVTAVADALGFAFIGARPPKGQLIDFLQAKQILLIMDNFEHVLQGAEVVADILDNTPDIKVLTTSLVRLNLPAECLYEVGEMAFPEDKGQENIEEFEAIQMFVAYARRTQPGYTPAPQDRPAIAQICQLVDGIPLGIELAAAWVRMLSPDEIVSELESNLDFLATTMHHIPDRHRSMRAAFDYSWDLLTPDEQKVFKNLSLFRGGFNRDAAKHIAGASLISLMGLVDKSLLHRDAHGRYKIHEMVRQYAAEKLDAQSGRTIQDLHSDYYASFLQEREALLKQGSRSYRAISQEIEAEIENIRLAWNWAVTQGKVAALAKGIYALGIFYDMHGWFQESLEMIRRAVAQLDQENGDEESNLILGKLLAIQGLVDSRIGEGTEAEALFARSLKLLSHPEYREERGMVLTFMSLTHLLYSLDYEETRQIAEEAMAIHKQFGNRWGLGVSLHVLALACSALGDQAKARQLLEESLTLWDQLESKQSRGRCLGHLGVVLNALGEHEEARTHLLEAEMIAKRYHDQWFILYALNGLGEVTLATGQYEEAGHYFYQVLQEASRNGLKYFMLTALVGISAIIIVEDPERAIAILVFVQDHPASPPPLQEKTIHLLDESKRIISTQRFDDAQKQGKLLRMNTAIDSALGALPSLAR